MYIKAAADTELEEFSKKVDCDRKILIATICEIKYITDWKSESVWNIIRVNNDFALFCSNYAWKKIPYSAFGMLAILITYLILLTILLAEFIQTHKGFFCSVT